MWETVGAKVNRLKRVRFGNVMLDAPLPAGRWRPLGEQELAGLLELAGMEVERPRRGVRKERKGGRQDRGDPGGRTRPGKSEGRRPGPPRQGKGGRGR